jgi:hypothetical protein
VRGAISPFSFHGVLLKQEQPHVNTFFTCCCVYMWWAVLIVTNITKYSSNKQQTVAPIIPIVLQFWLCLFLAALSSPKSAFSQSFKVIVYIRSDTEISVFLGGCNTRAWFSDKIVHGWLSYRMELCRRHLT